MRFRSIRAGAGRSAALAVVLAVASSTTAPGCGGAGDPSFEDQMREMGYERHQIPFEARIGEERWSCNDSFLMGSPAVEARPAFLKLFVYDVALVGDGDPQQLILDPSPYQGNFDDSGHNVALLDYDDATGNCYYADEATNSFVTGWAPPGAYQGLSFRIGLPTELNHLDAGLAPPPLNQPGLWWGWLDGFMLIRAEFETPNYSSTREQTPADTSAPLGWALWLAEAGYGPQACAEDEPASYSCPNQFQPRVLLEEFDPANDLVALDFGELLAEVDMNRIEFDPFPEAAEPMVTDPTITPYPMPDYGGGCFMDRVDGECAVILEKLGIDWMRMSEPDPAAQTFARGVR